MLKLDGTTNMIAISSAIFSGVSIIVTILSMTMEKSLIDSQEYTLIKIDVTGKCVQANSKKLQHGDKNYGIKVRMIALEHLLN